MIAIRVRAILPLLLAAILPAQGWQAVETLPPGSQIRVTAAKRHTARLVQSTANDITIENPAGRQTIERREVKKVELRKGRPRSHRVAIGAAAGAAAGTAVSTIAIAAASDDAEGPEISTAILILLSAGLFAAGGAAAGALWPHSWQMIYVP